MRQIKVCVWRDGLIHFRAKCPPGAICIASGPEKIVRDIVEVNATHCWDNKSFRVGNLATAGNDDDALDALCEFQHRIEGQIKKRLQAQPGADLAQIRGTHTELKTMATDVAAQTH